MIEVRFANSQSANPAANGPLPPPTTAAVGPRQRLNALPICNECGEGYRDPTCDFTPPCGAWDCSRGGPPCFGGVGCECDEESDDGGYPTNAATRADTCPHACARVFAGARASTGAVVAAFSARVDLSKTVAGTNRDPRPPTPAAPAHGADAVRQVAQRTVPPVPPPHPHNAHSRQPRHRGDLDAGVQAAQWQHPPARPHRNTQAATTSYWQMLGVNSDDEADAGTTAGTAAAPTDDFVWRVDSMTDQCMAGLGILRYSTPIREQRGLEHTIAGIRVPVLGVVDVTATIAGEACYIPRVLVIAGLDGGIWSPTWAGVKGFRTRLGFGPHAPESWMITPSGLRVAIDAHTHSFATTFTRPWVIDKPSAKQSAHRGHKRN